jgi:HK97 gp10 family phage protein
MQTLSEYLKKQKQEQAKRLKRAAIDLQNEIKKKIGKKSPPVSDPGAPPHLLTGELRRSIAHTVDEKELVARVGTNKIYGKYLELGTAKMEARPYLETTQKERENITRRILLGK